MYPMVFVILAWEKEIELRNQANRKFNDDFCPDLMLGVASQKKETCPSNSGQVKAKCELRPVPLACSCDMLDEK